MSTADKLNKLLETKQAIKQAIINKGVEIADDTKFADYPSKISSIPMEGGDPYYEEFYNLRTSNGTNMAGLFSYCTAPELDLSNLDVSNVTNMSDMFAYCKSSVNIDGWDTSKVTNTDEMFYQFFGTVDISNLDFSNVTSVRSMFYASNIDNIQGIGSIKNPQATNYTRMFSNVSGTLLDLSSWDVSHVTNMNSMFTSFSFKKIDLTGWVTTNVTDMSSIFSCYNSVLEELIIPDWDMTNVTKYTSFFNTSTAYTKNLKFVDLSRSNDTTIAKIASSLPKRTATTSGTVLVPANTSQEVCDTLAAKYWTAQKPEVPEDPVDPPVEDIPLYVPGEFEYDTIVTEVEVMVDESHDDLSNMFNGCTNLVSVNTEDWDTSNVTDMSSMFSNCTSLTQLDLSNFNTVFVWSMSSMFWKCTSLTTLDLSNWDTASIFDKSMDMFSMLDGCTSLHTLRLDNCSNDTIRKIIYSPAFSTNAIEGVTRTIYCKKSEAAGLTPPANWKFSYVD